jgi:hypothetical protein
MNRFSSFYCIDSVDGDNLISVDPETLEISFARKIR